MPELLLGPGDYLPAVSAAASENVREVTADPAEKVLVEQLQREVVEEFVAMKQQDCEE